MDALASDQPQFLLTAGSGRWSVVEFSGHEALSRLFEFTLTLASETPDVDPQSLLGTPATLEIVNRFGGAPRHINGIVSEFGLQQSGRRNTLYRLVLRPTAWQLTRRSDWRIFQEKTAREIITDVLQAADIPADGFRFELQREYPSRTYCVQAGESDLDFIDRVAVDDGLWYYFEHTDNAHTLVFVDANAVANPIDGVPDVGYHEPEGAVAERDHIFPFHAGRAVETGSVALRDYDFTHPALDLTTEVSDTDSATLQRYDYPGAYATGAEGQLRANARLQAHRAARVRCGGGGGCARLTPGRRFALTDHPVAGFNRDYLVTAVEHRGSQSQPLEEEGGQQPTEYDNRFTCIDIDTPYRARPRRAKPVVNGTQSAIVTGPPGEEIYVDEYGRVKVQFHWDRQGQRDENSSCWMRVSQQWAGAAWGGQTVPRIGHEVLVSYMDGDPDRPIITGRVYHATNVVPHSLPEHQTRTTLKSRTHQGQGFNELRFEDAKDAEEIYLHAQRNLSIETENDKTQSVGRDESLHVGRDRQKQVDNDEHVSIGRNSRLDVAGNHTAYVGEDDDSTVGGNQTAHIKGEAVTTVGESSETRIGDRLDIQAGDDITALSGTRIALRTGAASLVLTADGDIIIRGANVTIEASDSITHKANTISHN